MPEELPVEDNERNSFTELRKLNPDEINKQTYELLRIPIRLEYTYKYSSIEEAEKNLPTIKKVYQVKNHPHNYILTDSLGDRYFIGLIPSEKERKFIEEHREEYKKYNFLTFRDPNSQFPKREIYRLTIKIDNGQEIKKEQIEISYSREETTVQK